MNPMASSAHAVVTPQAPGNRPWWVHPHMWLVVGGPAAVVVASFVTLWMALRLPDPVVTGDHFRRAAEATQAPAPTATGTGSAWTEGATMAPAQQARNHAATPVAAGNP